jgi:light-regulated signal transduction histidine kinase (bacteriophytochrome)
VNDSRIEKIVEQIGRYGENDLEGKLLPSDKNDEIEKVVRALSELGEKLKVRQQHEIENRTRIDAIMNILLKYTIMDFSSDAKISEAGDEIDAIALGLNTLKEEFEYILIKIKESEKNVLKKSEELARSNTELEQFASVASHDLQEPLRMITSYVQLLEKNYKDKLDKDAGDFINFAVDGANRMRTLIQSLLEYSRVNREKPKEYINLYKVLEDVKKDLAISIEESGAKVIYGDLPVIWGDAVLINQLFLNLIGNAIKFRDEIRPLEIKIEAKKLNHEYLFSVRDNGIGIKEAYGEKIFVIFQRLHPKNKYPGTGIGLAICKKIVEKHEGRIWVESKENIGSTFYFTINADLKRSAGKEI